MFTSEYMDYRAGLLQCMCSNQAIKDLLTGDNNSMATSADLVDQHIYPYEFIPGTNETMRTFITMTLSTPIVKDRIVLKSRITLFVFTHEALTWAKDGNNKKRMRVDMIAEELNKMLNGSNNFGLKLQMTSRKGGYHPIDKYHGDMITFETADFNYKV